MKHEKPYVLAEKNFAMRPPLWQTLTAWLFLDRVQAAGWIYGVVGCVLAFAWIIFFIDQFSPRQRVSIEEMFGNHKSNN